MKPFQLVIKQLFATVPLALAASQTEAQGAAAAAVLRAYGGSVLVSG